MWTLFVVVILASFTNVIHGSWFQNKLKHKPQAVTNDDIIELAGLANNSLFDALLEPILIARVPTTQGHAVVKKHISDTLTALKWDVQLDTFEDATPLGRLNFTNIVATLDPSATRHLVLACHYDSKMDREKAMVLATDSAVPCAMMLYLATVLDKRLRAPRQAVTDVTLQLIFFDGEEAFVQWTRSDSLYGSRHLAEKMKSTKYRVGDKVGNHLDRMDVMVLLDLLGYKQPAFYSFFTDTRNLYDSFVKIERRLHTANQLMDHQQPYFVDQVMFGGIEDDHIPFIERGARVVHLIPYPFPPVWHKETDNKENLDFPTIYNLNKILVTFVAEYLHLPAGGATL